MSGFFDIHSHFLYGVDDGSRTAEEMQAMAKAKEMLQGKTQQEAAQLMQEMVKTME